MKTDRLDLRVGHPATSRISSAIQAAGDLEALGGRGGCPEEIQFFLRLHGLWEGIIQLPRPPPPSFDIDTMEPIEPPWQAIKEWIPDDKPDLDWFNRPRNPSNSAPDPFDQSPAWQPAEISLGDGRTLVLDDT